MTLEKITYPLMVAGAFAGVYLLLRKPSVQAANPFQGYFPVGFGVDPGTHVGFGDSERNQYLAEVPTYPLAPGYIARATSQPLATSPEDFSDPYSTNTPEYMTFNQDAPYTPYGLPAPGAGNGGGSGAGAGAGGCGGSCGCTPKCAADCDHNISFPDGRGTCLGPEFKIPPAPMDITFFNIQANGGEPMSAGAY